MKWNWRIRIHANNGYLVSYKKDDYYNKCGHFDRFSNMYLEKKSKYIKSAIYTYQLTIIYICIIFFHLSVILNFYLVLE